MIKKIPTFLLFLFCTAILYAIEFSDQGISFGYEIAGIDVIFGIIKLFKVALVIFCAYILYIRHIKDTNKMPVLLSAIIILFVCVLLASAYIHMGSDSGLPFEMYNEPLGQVSFCFLLTILIISFLAVGILPSVRRDCVADFKKAVKIMLSVSLTIFCMCLLYLGIFLFLIVLVSVDGF